MGKLKKIESPARLTNIGFSMSILKSASKSLCLRDFSIKKRIYAVGKLQKIKSPARLTNKGFSMWIHKSVSESLLFTKLFC